MKFLFKGYVLLILLVCLTIVSLFVGVSQLSLSDIFHLSEEQQNILFSSRIPRTVSILLSGSSLALAGLIMQQMMQNKFVSPTTAGTMEAARYFDFAYLFSERSHPNQVAIFSRIEFSRDIFICEVN